MENKADKKDIKRFFNDKASIWGINEVDRTEKINYILDIAQVKENSKVADIGCGTGVLTPYYIERKVSYLASIDIAENMLKEAEKKFGSTDEISIDFICADAETEDFGKGYDSIVVYNAFPHFPNPEMLIENAADALTEGGRFTIAHGMGRAELDAQHEKAAAHISSKLIHEDDLAELMSPYFDVDTRISEEGIYVVSGMVRK